MGKTPFYLDVKVSFRVASEKSLFYYYFVSVLK